MYPAGELAVLRQLLLLLFPLSGKRHGTVLSAYAPTITNPDEAKDKF